VALFKADHVGGGIAIEKVFQRYKAAAASANNSNFQATYSICSNNLISMIETLKVLRG
jgi:hypothetical protein